MKIRNNQFAQYFLVAGLVFGLASCTSGVTGTASYDRSGKHEMTATTENFILGMRIGIEDIVTTRVNDFMVADIRFKNKWAFSQDFKYRVHWFTEDGLEVNPESPSWTNVVITGKASQAVKVTAPNAEVTKLKVSLKD